ncbi:cytokinin dehydrogenase 3 [Impatiens glandulifera]|uniref:cytokinin dehydrogenase 3 n=1 Tax=Impatiens glandulifera TaxID=253017 RepID=UPI001FB19EB7|nr:cytokinin dehydrogenase 3 [Impatiens glandulifera]
MVNNSSLNPSFLIILFILSHLMSMAQKISNFLPRELLSLDIANRLRLDANAIELASRDFGKIVRIKPAAVLYPISVEDIVELVRFSYESETPFGVAGRGRGHSVKGQAMVHQGVVVEMTSLMHFGNENRVRVLKDPDFGFCVDAGGEQLWVDVLKATIQYGFAPISWTDYLYLTVGGTLSNAGISGQTFRYGPQINNVIELDVITGKGELVTCSKEKHSKLFYAVLGGLGQFGIITRARIPLYKAPKKVKWVRMLYHDFSAFTRDQEQLISMNDGLNYVEGSLIMDNSPPNNWRSSFFSLNDQSRINSLLAHHKILYCLEAVKYYGDDHYSTNTINEEVHVLLEDLSFIDGCIFKKDASYIDFLNRVRIGELKLQAQGLWDVPHPWLNLFVPKSRIMDFNEGVFVNIIHKQRKATGPLLVYPMNRNKWDDRMSAVIPNEEIFYTIGLLHSSEDDDWETLDNQNKEVLDFCKKTGIEVKEYISTKSSKEEWIRHFGSKWEAFVERKIQSDPKMILSPGQKIFN